MQSACVCGCKYNPSVGVTHCTGLKQVKTIHKQLSLRLKRTLVTFSQSLNTSPLPTFISAGYQTRGYYVMNNTVFYVTRKGSSVGQIVCDGRSRTARLDTLIATTLQYAVLKTPQHCIGILFIRQNSLESAVT